MIALNIGNRAPEFWLADHTGKTHSLKEYRGKWVLLYFYPKDNTPGCTKEACGVRDLWSEFKKKDTVVLGVSTDTVLSHMKFRGKYQLPFALLADEKKVVVQKYGVWGEKKFMGRTYQGIKRTSFLIDPKGVIVKIYENVKPPTHAREVLDDISIFKK